MEKILKMATRASKLALRQVEIVGTVLESAGLKYEIETVRTTGDLSLKVPIYESKGQGVFVKELNSKVANNEVDIAIHSAKDIPYEIDKELVIAYYSTRGSTNDFFISKTGFNGFDGKIGGSSIRRKRFISLMNRRTTFVNVRGNIETRIRKWEKGEADALVLAKVALDRLAISVPGEILDEDTLPPAPNQGYIAIVARRNTDEERILRKLADEYSIWEAENERRLMGDLELGCNVAASIRAYFDTKSIKFSYANEEKRYDFIFKNYPDKKEIKKLREIVNE